MTTAPSISSPLFYLTQSHNSTSRQGQATGYSPLKGVKWTANTNSKAMKELVEKREEVFAAHRRLKDPQLDSLNLATLNSCQQIAKIDYRCLFERYQEFCQVVNIPPLPLSTSTTALFYYAKNSYEPGHYPSFVAMLSKLVKLGRTTWIGKSGYDSLNGPQAVAALNEFLQERKGIIVRPRRSFKKSKVESATHHESGQAGEDEHEEMSEGQGGSAQNVNQLTETESQGAFEQPHSKKRKSIQNQSFFLSPDQTQYPSTSTHSGTQSSGSESATAIDSTPFDFTSFRPPRPSSTPQSFSPPTFATSCNSRSYNLASTQKATSSFSPVPYFLPELTSFLRSLDSALAPLAAILVGVGFDTPDSLTQFCSLDSPIRSRIAEQVQISMSGGEEVGELFELFEKKLAEAMASGLQ